MRQITIKYMIFSFFLFSISCNSSSANPEKTDEQKSIEKTAEGESYLIDGSFSDAINSFTNAITLNPGNSGAFAGLGWAYILSDSINQALESLLNGNVINNQRPEILSALAFIYNAKGDTSSLLLSNQFIISLISIDPNWVSYYGFNFSIVDIYVVLAQNYYILADYAASLDAINQIDPLFSVDLNSPTGKSQLSDKIESYNSGITKN